MHETVKRSKGDKNVLRGAVVMTVQPATECTTAAWVPIHGTFELEETEAEKRLFTLRSKYPDTEFMLCRAYQFAN